MTLIGSQEPASSVEAILNAAAGSLASSQGREDLSRLLEDTMPGIRISFAEGNQLRPLAEAAKARRCRMVIAGGGDGTINAIASEVAGTGIVLGILPLGTRNHFARDMGVTDKLEAAVHNLRRGVVREVDAAEVNGRIFVNNSGLGLYPELVRQRDRLQRRGVSKRMAALWAAIRALRHYRLLTIRVSVRGQEVLRHTPLVFVGNNQYEMEGLKAGTRVCLDAGQLCLYLPHPTSRLKLLAMSISALLGKLHRNEDFDVVLASELQIGTKRQRALDVTIDGEVTKMTGPLHYKIRPKALRVMVPAEKP
ncbi:MAG TPA: diacylglycerol kinase family protein [Terriglobales bacterium]|nr:diacylglycerol kinase family protein [Terriglobales bacterium]